MHKGLKLKPPEHCPPKLAELMNSEHPKLLVFVKLIISLGCFERDPENRPDFKKVLKVLGEIKDDVKANPFY